LDILHNALDACEGFLLGETYRDRAIDILRSNYQESLDLALKFEVYIYKTFANLSL
jgi:hypothetical protein